ncbi:MAG: hypothetical protein ACRDDX_10545 [Cellulosilyticaceae bacterium]
MKDVIMKFPVLINVGYETKEIEQEGIDEKVKIKVPVQRQKDLVIRAMSMDEYFESSQLKNQKDIWEYILEKQLVTPADMKNIEAWQSNLGALKYVISLCINFTLEPYAERWLPFHTTWEELTGI